MPTIGQIVWYYPDKHDNQQPLAAIITYVYAEDRVNLVAFNQMGITLSPPPGTVLFVSDADAPEEGCYCTPVGQTKGM